MYDQRGFTENALQILDPYIKADMGAYHGFRNVPRKVMLEVAKGLPWFNMEDQQNTAPTFGQLLYFDQVAYYEGYVIDASRGDERVTIDGIMIPPEVDLPGWVTSPDEDLAVEVNGRVYRRLWWG